MSDIVRVSFTVKEVEAVRDALAAEYPSPDISSAYAKLRKALENPLNGPTEFASHSDVEIPDASREHAMAEHAEEVRLAAEDEDA